MIITNHKILSSVLCVVILLLMTGVYFIYSPHFSSYVSGKVSASTHRKVDLTNNFQVHWGWPIIRVIAQNVTIGNFEQGTQADMLKIGKADISINLWSVLKGNVELPQVILDQPELFLEKDKDGNANWQFTENPGGHVALDSVTPDDRSDFPMIGHLVIREGKVGYLEPGRGIDANLKIETITGSADKRETLRLNGEGNFQNRKFLIDLEGGTIFQLKETDKPYPVNLNISVGNTKANLTGTMLDPLQFKGMDTVLTLSGKDASELFDIVSIALPPTPSYDVTGKLSLEDNVWHFREFTGHMGHSDLSGSVTWDTTKERPLLSGEFRSKKLNFTDLGGFVGAGPGANTKTKTDPYLIPDTPLDISRLKSMDAKVTFTGEKLISENLPLDDFFMNVDLDNSLLKLNPVRFGTAKGDISATMTVNARQEPVQIDGDFRFRRLDLKPIFASLTKTLGMPNYAEGYIGGTAQLKGTGKSLRQMLATSHGNIGLGMEGGQLNKLIIELLGLDVAQGLGLFVEGDEPVHVRCMIGDFKVNTGLMQVRHFVLDTTDSNILGTGTINLKNEALNLTLYTRPKDSSPLTLNSPINLKGTLKDPSVNLSLGNVAGRGAVAVALGALVFPVVAIAAFIEPAFGKDSPCATLVTEMSKHTGKTKSENLIPKNKTLVR